MNAIYAKSRPKGYATEYVDNFTWGEQSIKTRKTRLFNKDGTRIRKPPGEVRGTCEEFLPQDSAEYKKIMGLEAPPPVDASTFRSQKYESIYRDTCVRKDDRGKYIDPFNNIATKPYGRRLMYDDTHPEKMYSSQWSSEIADPAGCYSFPFPTGLRADQPFCKDLSWQIEGEQGCWPTQQWKEWTNTAECPPYTGHSDQCEYSQYKVQVP